MFPSKAKTSTTRTKERKYGATNRKERWLFAGEQIKGRREKDKRMRARACLADAAGPNEKVFALVVEAHFVLED